MKKIVFTLIASMMMISAMASDATKTTENAEVANYDMTVDYDHLAHTLSLDGDQLESVRLIHGDYIRAMKAAAKAPEEKKSELVRKATLKELTRLRYVLDRDQYRKYNMLINATLNNRGLLK